MIIIPLKVGHRRLASKTPFKWRFTGMSMMAQHLMLTDFSGDPDQYCQTPYIL